MTIYEFILKHSTYGKELFPDSLTLLKLKRMTDEEKIKFLKDYDKKKKPKRTRKKVDNKKEKADQSKESDDSNLEDNLSDAEIIQKVFNHNKELKEELKEKEEEKEIQR